MAYEIFASSPSMTGLERARGTGPFPNLFKTADLLAHELRGLSALERVPP